MDAYGRITVLLDGNDDYFYYYQLNDEQVFRACEDGEMAMNPTWDVDILIEDLDYLARTRGFDIEYMDDTIIKYLREEEDYFETYSGVYEYVFERIDEYEKRSKGNN